MASGTARFTIIASVPVPHPRSSTRCRGGDPGLRYESVLEALLVHTDTNDRVIDTRQRVEPQRRHVPAPACAMLAGSFRPLRHGPPQCDGMTARYLPPGDCSGGSDARSTRT